MSNRVDYLSRVNPNFEIMKKQILLLLSIFAMVSTGLQAQDKEMANTMISYAPKDSTEGWKFSGLAGATFGQTLLHNWSAGGDNTFSMDLILNASANYKKGLWFWDNNLSGEYGMIYSSSTDWQKSADKITLMSVAGRNISNKWSASMLINFNTQFARGYNYPDRDNYISTIMAPGYLNGALGFTYKPNEKYTVFLSPVAERATFVLNDSLSAQGLFGVDPGKKVLWQTGAYVMATTSQSFGDLGIISTLDMFTPYNSEFGNININWDILLNYKINKLFTATLKTTIRYYDAELEKIQVKEILGLGLTYKF